MRAFLIILILITPTALAADLSDDDTTFVSMDYMEIGRHAYQYGYRNTAPNAYHDGYNHTISFGSSVTQTNTSMMASDGNTTTAWTLNVNSQAISGLVCSNLPHVTNTNHRTNLTIADHYQGTGNLDFNVTTIELDGRLARSSGTAKSCWYAIGYLDGQQVDVAYSDACSTLNQRCLTWLNFSSEVRIDQIALWFGATGCTSSCTGSTNITSHIHELSIYSDDDGYSPMRYTYANTFATAGKVVYITDNIAGFGSDNITLAPGSYTALLYHPYDLVTGNPTTQNDSAYDWGLSINCQSVSCTNSTNLFITPHRNVTGGGTCMATYIEFYNPTAQEVNFSNSDEFGAADNMCVLTEAAAANLLTPARAPGDYKIVMDFSDGFDINGDALGSEYEEAVAGFLMRNNQIPFVSLQRGDMQWTSGGDLALENVTTGSRTFSASPSVGDTFLVSLPSSTPYQFFGNGVFLGMSQAKPTTAEPADWEVLINDAPASYVTSFENDQIVGALFYIDDMARRNDGTVLSNATEFTSNYRPFGTESYFAELIGDGWDPDVALKNLLFIGYEGHEYLACRELCWTYYEGSENLPTTQDNTVRFYVIDSSGSPLTDARVTLDLNSTSLYVPSHGRVNWTNIFQTAEFTISKAGYQSECGKFYFISSGSASSGYDGSCRFVRGYNASFTVVLLTEEEAGVSGEGEITINNTLSDNVTIIPNPGNFTVPAAANFTVEDVDTTLYFAIFKQTSNGNLIVITPVTQLLQNGYGLYNVTWPARGYTTNTTALNQVGSYVLAIADENADVQALAPFIIRDTTNTPTYIDTNNSLIVGSIITQITPLITTTTVSDSVPTSRSFVADATQFAFDDPFLIPNMWLILLIMIIVAIMFRRAERSE